MNRQVSSKVETFVLDCIYVHVGWSTKAVFRDFLALRKCVYEHHACFSPCAIVFILVLERLVPNTCHVLCGCETFVSFSLSVVLWCWLNDCAYYSTLSLPSEVRAKEQTRNVRKAGLVRLPSRKTKNLEIFILWPLISLINTCVFQLIGGFKITVN